ncbi:hypothetical protein AAG570_013954 [Ranatra chinensis]|uniref:BTB domain-containing protein n=1 Tax=Ranatra chinensis TaxID=642074 RepID=A0ABD0YZY8_9HEMI
MGDQFCLKWNNHQSTLISIFDTLLDSGNHVDCSLAAEGKSVNAHKVILSACSPYLEYLLNQHQDKFPVLVFSDLKFHELKAMLEYMYRGEVNVVQEQLNGFLKAAEALQIKGLTDQGGGGGGGGGAAKRKQGPSGLGREAEVTGASVGDDCASMSPSTSKRRRQRRGSHDQQTPDDTSSNSCDILSNSSTVAAPVVTKPKLETASAPAPPTPGQTTMLIKEKLEPPDLIQPKAEYMEDPNDDHIEDLTLDDDDDDDSYMAKPGSSHAPDSQGTCCLIYLVIQLPFRGERETIVFIILIVL